MGNLRKDNAVVTGSVIKAVGISTAEPAGTVNAAADLDTVVEM